MACPKMHTVHYLACLPHTLYLARLGTAYTKPGSDQPCNPVCDLRHWFSLCFADASVKHDACYMFKNTVLLMQKSGLLIEFKSDDVMRITFWNYGICWDILKGLLAKNVHFRANCLWDISPVMLRLLHTNPSKFAFVHNLINQTITWLISLRQFALTCQFLASRPFGCFFLKRISRQIP